MIGNGESGRSKFNALITNSIENEKVFDEIVFSLSKRFPIPSSGIVDIVFDPTACSCDYLVFLPVTFKAFGAGPINIDLYFGADIDDDGTILESGNRDNTSTNTTDLVVRLNPTVNDVGIKTPFEFVIFSDGTPAVTKIGGESRDGLVSNVRKDGKYLFRLINTEAAAAGAHIASNWFKVN